MFLATVVVVLGTARAEGYVELRQQGETKTSFHARRPVASALTTYGSVNRSTAVNFFLCRSSAIQEGRRGRLRARRPRG